MVGLAQILYPPPTDHGFEEWAYAHFVHHAAIITAASNQGYTLTQYQIWPLPKDDFASWLEQHQAMHTEMDAIANVIGNDLQDVDFQDKKARDGWFYLHWTEHSSVAAFLGQGV